MVYIIIPQWWNLPLYVALIYLGATRTQLSENNLYDTYLPGELPVSTCAGINTAARTLNGLCNNLDTPGMGAVGTRFSRFVPINDTWGETDDKLYTPNPRTISQELFKRKSFTPATLDQPPRSSNTAWIQFQTHDWFSHGAVNDPNNLMVFPLPASDPLLATGQTNMTLRRTLKETHGTDRPATYNNINTHWWDLSQVYGVDETVHAKLRSGVDGKLLVAEDGLLPVGPDGLDVTGFNDNWWVGLSMLHNIWTKEHNLVADMFKKSNPTWTDQQLFDHARLVTTALNAKIHTVEWTPALLQDEILQTAMNANWYGLAPAWLQSIPDIFSQKIAEAWYGIVGGKPDFAGVSFAHSEEFVSVYRFHSLLRDNITIRNHVDGKYTANSYNISQYAFRGAQDVIRGNNFSDVVYTFATDYPRFWATIPPRCSHSLSPAPRTPWTWARLTFCATASAAFPATTNSAASSRSFPAKTMDDISDDKNAVASLRAIYGEDVEAVDMLAGSLAESPRATGFAFSNTQFQAFILAASRRLMTDRFFTTDYTAGCLDNAFKPWVVPS
ncbi:heme peroxidase [Mycena olivaceomarginata]|nr:heme peroxidase [Mycena olivaceomarginata]